MAEPVIRTEELTKSFHLGGQKITIFTGLNFEISSGECVALVGKSGAGKSTLLHILGALDTPTSGKVFFQDKALDTLSESKLAYYRNRNIGYVWQSCHLLPEFTALENVALPLRVHGVSEEASHHTARKWLERVGLANRAIHQSGELSGGEQQRTAIARALVSGPALLLADEPTGNLDETTGGAVMDMLLSLVREENLSILIATHNPAFASLCDRVLSFGHGQLIETRRSQAAT